MYWFEIYSSCHSIKDTHNLPLSIKVFKKKKGLLQSFSHGERKGGDEKQQNNYKYRSMCVTNSQIKEFLNMMWHIL